MALVSIEEAMEYLRVDSSDETVLIESLLIAAEKMCIDVARLSEKQWAAINATPREKSTDDTDDESDDEDLDDDDYETEPTDLDYDDEDLDDDDGDEDEPDGDGGTDETEYHRHHKKHRRNCKKRELAYKKEELKQVRALMKAAIYYSLAYLYEHREEADHHELMLTLRNLLFSLREGVI